jgi:hypothetical protein
MRNVKFKDRKIRSTSKGGYYIALPKVMVEMLPGRVVNIEKTEEGLLLRSVVPRR